MLRVYKIPHHRQAYDTVGNWTINSLGDWSIEVSDLDNWKMEFLIALHEQIEMALCKARGISEGAVTAFDKQFEAERRTGDDSEPGDSPHSPYRLEHGFATDIERKVALELGVDWDAYEKKIAGLEYAAH